MEFSDEERAIIRAFANQEADSRAAAVSVYYDGLERGVSRFDPFMLFMSEATSKVPDLALRAQYRQQVLATEIAPAKADKTP